MTIVDTIQPIQDSKEELRQKRISNLTNIGRGRPKGSLNKRTLNIIEQVKEDSIKNDTIITDIIPNTHIINDKVETRGRKKGTLNKKSLDITEQVNKAGANCSHINTQTMLKDQTPMEFLMSVYSNLNLDLKIRIEAARIVMPYVHNKLPTENINTIKNDTAANIDIKFVPTKPE